MGKLLDPTTLLTMGSALAVAILFQIPSLHETLFFYLGYRLLEVGHVLFHEMGHATFFWLFGRPALPSILTAIGTDMAGGVTIPFAHSWVVQGMVWLALAYGLYQLYFSRPALFLPALIGFIIAVGLAFTRSPELIATYMGHGSAIFVAGVLLYRAWLNIIVRTPFERWLNALFGFFILIGNGLFSYQLLSPGAFRDAYENHPLTNDFVLMTDQMPHWRVHGIAQFTLVYVGLTLILSFVLAGYFYEDEHYDDV